MNDLNQMAAFARVVARGSFTSAARDLRVPPSTLSRQVAALERRLGTRLLERTTRRLRLTDAGTLYYERCARIVREAEDADGALQALSSTPQGTLRLSAPPVLGEVFLGAPIAEYLRRFRGVKVEVSLSARHVDLVGERYDLALRVARSLADSSLIVRRVGTSTPLLCASPEYVRANGMPRTLEDLEAHGIIDIRSAPAEPVWIFLGKKDEAVEVKLAPRVRVNHSGLALDICRSGGGIAKLPSFLAVPRLADGTLVHLLPEFRLQPLEVSLLLPSARQLSSKVRAFLDVVDRHLDRHRPWS